MNATMSILGMYNYDNTIFDGFKMPDGMDDETQQAIKDNILIECAELEILLPEPSTLRRAIEVWSTGKLPSWQRIFNVLQEKYKALENYNRTDDFETEDSGTNTIQSDSNGTSEGNYKVAGYDDESLVDRESNSGSSSSHNTQTETLGTKHTHKGSSSGNIGVTTSQQMLEQEVEVARHNIMDVITEAFKDRFCILIY